MWNKLTTLTSVRADSCLVKSFLISYEAARCPHSCLHQSPNENFSSPTEFSSKFSHYISGYNIIPPSTHWLLIYFFSCIGLLVRPRIRDGDDLQTKDNRWECIE